MSAKPYAASSKIGNKEYGHSFYAKDERDAERIAMLCGWQLDGELLGTLDITEDQLAAIQYVMGDETKH